MPESPATNAQIIWGIMASWGATPAAIAGVLGNMESESGIVPDIWESGQVGNMSVGYGLVQWTPASKFIDWANARGLDYKTIQTQMERIKWEADNSQQWYGVTTGQTFWVWMRSANDPCQAAWDFLRDYERPYNPNQPARCTQAQSWYHAGTTGNWGDTGGGGNPNPPPPPGLINSISTPFHIKHVAGGNSLAIVCPEFPNGILCGGTIGGRWMPVWGNSSSGGGGGGTGPTVPPDPNGSLKEFVRANLVGTEAQTVRNWYNRNIANIGASGWDWCGAWCAFAIAHWLGSVWRSNLANAWAPNWPKLPGFASAPDGSGNTIVCHDWDGDGSCDHVTVFDEISGSQVIVFDGNGAGASRFRVVSQGIRLNSVMGYVNIPSGGSAPILP